MNKLLRYSFVALLAMVFGNVSAQEFVFDFTDETNPWGFPTEQLKETGTFTKDGKSIVVTTTNYTRWFSDTKVLLFGKKDATLTLPAFDFDVERIDVVGASGASGKVTFNIFVGDEAVSTEVTGAKSTATFIIAEGKQAAGTVYVIKNTNANNNQIAKILIWKKGTAGETPEPTHIENTEETAYTVAKAFELIDAGEALSETVFVKGIVSQVDSYNETYKSITYWISDDGTTDRQLQVYSGKGLEGADFASIDDVKVGAKVIIKGKIKKYNTTYEFDKNNELVKYEAPGATTTYKITITNTEHGNITLDKYEAAAGEKVSVIGMSVDEGYEMNEPTIVAANGEVVKIGGSDEEGHYLIMPASDVVISLNISKLYTITVNFDSSMGDVRGISFDSEKSPIYKGAGKNVKFNVIPNTGNKVESVTAADEDKNPITVNVAADLSYYEFEMPAKNVTITAVFSGSAADTWTVAGTLPLVNNEWDPTDTSADMMPNGNGVGVSSYEKDNIVLEAGTKYEFKICKNHSWTEAYPAQNYSFTVEETGKYHFKVFFNTTTHAIELELFKTGEAGPIEHTYSVIGDFFGDTWTIDYDMTKGEDGLYKVDIENVAAGAYEFKVRADKAWTSAYPSSNYMLKVEKDGSNVTITFNEETGEVKAVVSMPVVQDIVWSFTSWKTSTVSALIADAANSKTSGWSDVEKKTDAEAGADPTEASKDNCFWCVAEPNEDGTLSANGEVIEELKGLKWNKTYTTARSLAIAVNYPATSLGDYAGGAYLWLGGGGKSIPCFTIPSVKAGSTITMEVESHSATDARGVELYSGLTADGKIDANTKIGDSFKPIAKDTHTWKIEADGDVIVYNTKGCHLYSLKVVEGDATGISVAEIKKVQNDAIYNLSGQKVGKDYKGIVIVNGRKFMQK